MRTSARQTSPGDDIRQYNNTKQTTQPATENNIQPKTLTEGEVLHLLFFSQGRNPIMGHQVNVLALKSGLIRGKSDRTRARESESARRFICTIIQLAR